MRVDPQRQPFVVLIGGRDWAAEMTLSEARLLQNGVETLIAQLAALAPVLVPEETLELEHAAEGLWLQLSGLPGAWSLRFVLEPQPLPAGGWRGLEGGWDHPASAALAAALQGLVLP